MSWVFQQLRESGLKPSGATYGLAMEVITGLQYRQQVTYLEKNRY